MKISFHYYTIKILAYYAGFNEDIAQLIAYASQYVDDCDKHKPVTLKTTNLPEWVRLSDRYNSKNNSFDPTCTSHKKVWNIITLLKKDTQYKVFVPFHFIPNKRIVLKTNDLDFLTIKNGDLIQEYISTIDLHITNENAIKLGIALHAYADTWAHQGFCGIHSKYNDLKQVEVFRDNSWSSKKMGFIPDIGHGEAGSFPDITKAKWRYKYAQSHIQNASILNRENTILFIESAEAIFKILLQFTNSTLEDTSWKEKLIKCFTSSYDDNEVVERIYKEFNHIPFSYNENEWEDTATANGDEKWFLFQKQSLIQRMFVVKDLYKP